MEKPGARSHVLKTGHICFKVNFTITNTENPNLNCVFRGYIFSIFSTTGGKLYNVISKTTQEQLTGTLT